MIVHPSTRGGLIVALLVFVAGAFGLDDPQRPPGEQQTSQIPAATPATSPQPEPRPAEPRGIPADIANPKLLETGNLKPIPPAAIPDDPPPHEGAMIDQTYIIEPPDLLVVELLEALPGRPIQGEHLVRPDGTIGLGFYGDVHVRGLTLPQAKAKIVLHLRKYISDEALGLEIMLLDQEATPVTAPPLPDVRDLFDIDGAGNGAPAPKNDPAPEGQKPPGTNNGTRPTGAEHRAGSEAEPRVRPASFSRITAQQSGVAPKPLTAHLKARDEPKAPEPAKPADQVFQVGPNMSAKITIELINKENPNPVEWPGAAAAPNQGSKYATVNVAPEDTDRVFVDIGAYNSKVYFVQGEVTSPGRLPITGLETILDAVNYAGGLTASADKLNIRLVRPARGGKPARIYPIDIDGITERGEKTENLQIFPGDRLVIGSIHARNPRGNARNGDDRRGEAVVLRAK